MANNNSSSPSVTPLEIEIGLGVVALVLIYFGIVKPIFNKIGLTKSAETKAAEALVDAKNAQTTTDTKSILNTGIKPTFQPSQYNQFADVIYNARKHYFSMDRDPQTAIDTLKRMNKDLDVSLLIQAYGSRKDLIFGFDSPTPMGLIAGLRDKLDATDLEDVNLDWTKKGITYKI